MSKEEERIKRQDRRKRDEQARDERDRIRAKLEREYEEKFYGNC